jgi:undecaprenyl pyrophosphate phosphatase UppP
MDLVSVFVVLIVVGVLLWLVETQLPMAPPVKAIIRVLVVILVIVWLLRVFAIVLPGLR